MYRFVLLACGLIALDAGAATQTARSGNPILSGWYADPEAASCRSTTGRRSRRSRRRATSKARSCC
jgi:hypothetical protein